MCLGDLAAEHQANPRSLRFGSKKGNEQVGAVNQARPLISDQNFGGRSVLPPRNLDAPAGLESRIGRVADEIDQKLFQLVRIGANMDRWARGHFDWQPLLPSSDPPPQRL